MRAKYDAGLFPAAGEDKEVSEIFFAVGSGNARWLSVLIKSGADINEQIKKVVKEGFYVGETPAHIAIRSRQPGCMQLLLDANVNLELTAQYNKLLSIRQMMMLGPNKAIYEVMLREYDARRSAAAAANPASPRPGVNRSEWDLG